jgi:hypothetical protein
MNRRAVLIGLAVVTIALAALTAMAVWTRPIRRSVSVYSELISIANRPDLAPAERLRQASRLCSKDYLRTHPLSLAAEGGIVGLPRSIHKNFQAWRQGSNVWLCPTNRVGPVYQFVPEGNDWRFDGPVGVLQARGEFLPDTGIIDAPD